MDDREPEETLEVGGPEGGGHRTAWLVGSVAVIAAGVAAVLVVQQGTASSPPPTASSTTSTASSTVSATTSTPTPAQSPLSPSPSVTADTGQAPLFGKTTGGPTTGRPRTTSADISFLHPAGDYDVFVRTDDAVLRIQVGRGRVTRTPVPHLDSSGPVSFVVRRGVAFVHPHDVVSDYRVRDGKPARPDQRIPDGGTILPGPRPNEVWVPAKGRNNEVAFVLRRTDGSAVGPRVQVPAGIGYTWNRSDGAGDILVSGLGGAYISHGGPFHRVSTGQVIATGPRALVLYECDDEAHCGPVAWNRVSKTRRRLPAGAVAVGPGSIGVTSPDGTKAAIATSSNSNAEDAWPVTLFDLRTGQSRTVHVQVSSGVGGAAMAWSPDSRWLFVAGREGKLRAVDSDSGKVWAVDVPNMYAEQVAVRP